MKKLLVFMIFCIPVYAWGDNAIFNPGFDMSPWDTGWTIETDTVSEYYTSAEAEVKTDSGRSLPNCCYLRTYVRFMHESGGGNSGKADAKAMVTQNFDDITDCVIKVRVKYYLHHFGDGVCWSQCSLQVCVNDNWKTIWQKHCWQSKFTSANCPVFDTVWAEICTTFVNDTISGVRFCAASSVYTNCGFGPFTSYGHFYVDDVYVGKVGVEESEELQVTSHKLQVYPNPFVRWTEVRCQKSDVREKVKVYDMVGKLVEETTKDIVGKNLCPGVYFVKVGGYKPIKIIKLGRMQ